MFTESPLMIFTASGFNPAIFFSMISRILLISSHMDELIVFN